MPPFSLHSPFHFYLCVVCVLGVNWGPASGSECSNKQQALLSPAAEGGWGRVQKLSRCALIERFSGNTSASEKWWLEMHLSSRVGYFKYEELIVADLRINLQVGHFHNVLQACQVLRTGMWIHRSSKAGFQIQLLFVVCWHPVCLALSEDVKVRSRIKGSKAFTCPFFFFPWKSRKVWKVSILSQYGMENSFSTWTYSWNGNKQFPAHFYSWFFILSMDFRLLSPNTFEYRSLQEMLKMVARVWVKMEDSCRIKSIPHFPSYIFIVFLWPSTNISHLGEEKYDESLS